MRQGHARVDVGGFSVGTAGRRQLRTLLLGAALSGAFVGCGTGDSAPPQLQVAALDLQRIEWTDPAPAMTTVGRVDAVAEAGDDIAIFGSGGLFVWSSGSSVGGDGSVRDWQAAAAVPALGLPGTWLIGVDKAGRIYRLKNGALFGLEDVTARYVLQGKPVREVVTPGGGLVVFALDDKLAVTDGVTLKLYDLPLRNLVAGHGRVAAYDQAGVRVWDPAHDTLQQLDVPGIVGVAFAPDGTLWAATADVLYVEQDGGLLARHQVDPSTPIRGLEGAARGIWVALGDSLALLRDDTLLLAATSPMLAPGTKLSGSPSGDVWVRTTPDGALARYGEESGGGRDLTLWRQKMQPIFSRLCQGCHLAGGSAHIDLSTYSSWAKLRAQLSARVVDRAPTPMPPAGGGQLTDAEMADLRAWVARTP